MFKNRKQHIKQTERNNDRNINFTLGLRFNGLGQLPTKILKEDAEAVSGPLNVIFNACVSQGKIIDRLKDAVVSPIYKKDDLL